MPTISRFFGIDIRMYYEDHEPAHFHVYYAEYSATVVIESLEIAEGYLPRRAFRMVLEWAIEHRHELRANWSRAQAHRSLRQIAPLD